MAGAKVMEEELVVTSVLARREEVAVGVYADKAKCEGGARKGRDMKERIAVCKQRPFLRGDQRK